MMEGEYGDDMGMMEDGMNDYGDDGEGMGVSKYL
jgi:hypothetical protein